VISRYVSRLIKELRFLLPLILFLLFAYNFTAPPSSFQEAKAAFLYRPTASSALAIIEPLLETNQVAEAERFVVTLAASRSPLSLSDRQQLLPLLSQFAETKAAPRQVSQEILYWEEIVARYPTHRDAYLRLAILNLKLKRLFDARRHLESARNIDPGYSLTRRLEILL
jgi:hypothetical protein